MKDLNSYPCCCKEGELVVEADRGFEDVGLLSLLIQPGELVVQVDRMCAVS